MKRDLWMPLYIGDYLADTGHLSTTQHGAYLLIMMHYWRKQGLPDDDKQLAAIAKLPLRIWLDMKETIQAFFVNGWEHKRIEGELQRRAVLSQKRAESGAKGGSRTQLKNIMNEANASVCSSMTQSQSQKEDRIVEERAGAFTEGSRALRSALWRALGISSPLEVPLELAGTDWRAVTWEQAGWTADLIEAEARRIGPGKPLSYYEKCFATAFAKRQAPLPVVKVREAETLTVAHGRTGRIQETQSLPAVARRLAETGITFGDRPATPSVCDLPSGDNVRLLPQGGSERPGDLRGGDIGGPKRIPSGGDRLHHGPQDGLAEQIAVAAERVRSS